MKQLRYAEKKRHGSPDFPIEYYYLDSRHPRYIMLSHWHREVEIIRVLKGGFRVWLEDREFALTAGDILLVEPGCLHRGEPEDGCIYECLVFDARMMLRQPNDAIEKYITPLLNAGVSFENKVAFEDIGIRETVDRLFAETQTRARYYELAVHGTLCSLFAQLYSGHYLHPQKKPLHNRRIATITAMIDWIDENYRDSITLTKLSALTGLNAKYICRIFREYTDKTVIEYINELRVENACYEMRELGTAVTVAAFDSGFNDLSYFAKVFKRYKGIPPREYRKLS